MIGYIISVFVGLIGGFIIAKLLKNDDLDTDTCLAHLQSRGYWVRLNVGPNSRGKDE